MTNDYSKITEPGNRFSYECNYCNKLYPSENKISRHISSCKNSQPILLQQLPKIEVENQQLQYHHQQQQQQQQQQNQQQQQQQHPLYLPVIQTRLSESQFATLILKIQQLRKEEEFIDFEVTQEFKTLKEVIMNLLKLEVNKYGLCKNWAKSLRDNLYDTNAIYINDCRRIWIYFYKRLSKFTSLKEINLSDSWYRKVRTMLVYCLPLDKANALYHLRIPWYRDPRSKPEGIAENTRPTQSQKIHYLIEHFRLDTDPEIEPHLIPEFYLEVLEF